MSLLKNLAVKAMYIYIFAFGIYTQNIVLIVFSILIFINLNRLEAGTKKDAKSRLNKQRERFIKILSHDLRIPVIAQIRALELLNKEGLWNINNSQKEILTQIESSCRCILNLMSLLINIYKMENNEYKFIYENFNLSDIIISCLNELLPPAKEKNITFEFNNPNPNINITADKDELKKVIFNILSASITNANVGEKISVILSHFNNSIRITVKGYSQAISQIETHFTPVGNNIRLGFCKKIIDRHHGKITCNKDSFSFELPQYIS